MNQFLAGILAFWIVGVMFFPGAIGESVGRKAGQFMKAFEIEYRANR